MRQFPTRRCRSSFRLKSSIPLRFLGSVASPRVHASLLESTPVVETFWKRNRRAIETPRGFALARRCYDECMLTVRARVKNGRLVLDEPTDLPEGAEVELAAVEDDLDDDGRVRLHAALDVADDELRAGKGIPAEQVIAALRRGEL